MQLLCEKRVVLRDVREIEGEGVVVQRLVLAVVQRGELVQLHLLVVSEVRVGPRQETLTRSA